MLDVPREVDAPDLRRRSVAQGAQRNRELGVPAGRGQLRLHFPARVPVDVDPGARSPGVAAAETTGRAGAERLALVPHLRVVLDPGHVRAEDEAVLTIVVRVEDHPERVHRVEARITPRIRRDDAGGIGVVADDADVDHLVVVQQPHLGPLARRQSLGRLGLDEVGDRLDGAPRRLVEDPVDHRRRLGARRRQSFLA